MQSANGGASVPRALGDGCRYRLVLFQQRRSVRSVAEAYDINPSHLQRVINGERPATPAILRVLRFAVGDAGWEYATGQSDRLPTGG